MIDLKAGDFFAVQGKGIISRLINALQKFWSKDHASIYSHAGLILDPEGTTLEAIGKGTLSTQNLFEAYTGQRIIIARYDNLTPELHEKAIEALRREFEGEGYPIYRLFLNLFPPLAKLHFLGRGVCSEVVAYYLWKIVARHRWWASTNPDTLADEWIRWKAYSVIYDGILK